ncbi:hypothetical protein V3C99_013033 [Haemonchus contortus]
MTCSVVVDGSGSTTRLQSPERNRCFKRRTRNSIARDFGKYELIVLAITQLSYIPITNTMLSTAFYEPTESTCAFLNGTGEITTDSEFFSEMINIDFHSLLMDWGEACQQSGLTAFMSTSLMAGALTGSFTAGWLADTYGRLPVLKGCLLLVCIINGVFSIVATVSWVMSAAFMFTLGAGCGGYMVTNLVLLVESLDHPGSRLLGVSLNGWSFSMIFVALLARLTRHWFLFHLFTSAMALVAFLAFQIWVVESCRWLASVHRNAEAHSVAVRVVSRDPGVMDSMKDWQWWEILGFSEPAISAGSAKVLSKKYTYADLFSHSSVYIPLFALCYCFVSSSVVSFGFYFNADALPGNRYVNMAIMGFSKFVMGLIPFAVSPLVGRRPIVSISVGVACLCAWLTVISQSYGLSAGHWSLVAFSLIVSAALDPAWKINHLYSAELFPTVVRNMARAVCNVGARLGSVLAPMVVHLRTVHYLIPYLAFAVFLTVQLIVVVVCIPETKDRPLPEELPPKRSGSRDQQLVELNPAMAGSQIHEPT